MVRWLAVGVCGRSNNVRVDFSLRGWNEGAKACEAVFRRQVKRSRASLRCQRCEFFPHIKRGAVNADVDAFN